MNSILAGADLFVPKVERSRALIPDEIITDRNQTDGEIQRVAEIESIRLRCSYLKRDSLLQLCTLSFRREMKRASNKLATLAQPTRRKPKDHRVLPCGCIGRSTLRASIMLEQIKSCKEANETLRTM